MCGGRSWSTRVERADDGCVKKNISNYTHSAALPPKSTIDKHPNMIIFTVVCVSEFARYQCIFTQKLYFEEATQFCVMHLPDRIVAQQQQLRQRLQMKNRALWSCSHNNKTRTQNTQNPQSTNSETQRSRTLTSMRFFLLPSHCWLLAGRRLLLPLHELEFRVSRELYSRPVSFESLMAVFCFCVCLSFFQNIIPHMCLCTIFVNWQSVIARALASSHTTKKQNTQRNIRLLANLAG